MKKDDENKPVKTVENNPTSLIKLAIEHNADIDKLERLMALQERWQAQEAKKAHLRALSEFQAKCPRLVKGKSADFGAGKAKYSYIELGDIREQIKDLMFSLGLSYRWETEEKEGRISISCVVSHADGHSERNTMEAEKDTSGGKNIIQQRGSTMTYLQRYTLVGALGISTADADNDAGSIDNVIGDIGKVIDKCETLEALQIIWDNNPSLQKNKEFTKPLNAKKQELRFNILYDLFTEKEERVSSEERENFKRIIDKKESASYLKAIKILEQL